MLTISEPIFFPILLLKKLNPDSTEKIEALSPILSKRGANAIGEKITSNLPLCPLIGFLDSLAILPDSFPAFSTLHLLNTLEEEFICPLSSLVIKLLIEKYNSLLF